MMAVAWLVMPVAAPKPVSQHVAGQVQAESLGGLFKKLTKPRSKKKKKGKNNNVGMKIIQGVGLGIVGVGIANGDAGAIILGTVLATAPVVFQEEMNRKYAKDRTWAGCLNCNQKRILVAPGRTVTTEEQRAIQAKITLDVKDIQGALKTLGFYSKKIDGDYGRGSRAAASLFQKSLLDPETGKLTAKQRSELFKQASIKGFEPDSDSAKASLIPAAKQAFASEPAAAISEPTIKQYKLAGSQVEKFTTNVLQNGDLTEVKEVKLLPDGTLEIAYGDAASLSILRGGVEDVTVAPHDLSDSWIQVSMLDKATGETVLLNTIDSFSAAEEASKWQVKAVKKIALLKKLTERESDESQIVIAKTDADTPSEPKSQKETASAALPAKESKSPEVAVVSDGDNLPAKVTQVAAPSKSEPKQCGESVYLSFNFPEGEKRVDHYNITPPDGAFMADNGDATAYMAGTCVQGEYLYKYVVVDHDKKNKTWKSVVHEGSFEIAGLAGQCEIDLNDPTKSATLSCF